jgi:hypothetical protein
VGGHSVFACALHDPEQNTSNDCHTPHFTGSGIVYCYGDGTADTPDPAQGGVGPYTQTYRYGLIAKDQCDIGSVCPPEADIGLWTLRYHRNDNPLSPDGCHLDMSCPYANWANMHGNASDGADRGGGNPPWQWDDDDDGPVYAGDWFADPVRFFDIHLDGACHAVAGAIAHAVPP